MDLKRFYCCVVGLKVSGLNTTSVTIDRHISPFAAMAVDRTHASGIATVMMDRLKAEHRDYTSWNAAVNEYPDEAGTVVNPHTVRILPLQSGT